MGINEESNVINFEATRKCDDKFYADILIRTSDGAEYPLARLNEEVFTEEAISHIYELLADPSYGEDGIRGFIRFCSDVPGVMLNVDVINMALEATDNM